MKILEKQIFLPWISTQETTLALKHYEWVQKEVEQLERAGIITRSVSPWASPNCNSAEEISTRQTPEEKNVY